MTSHQKQPRPIEFFSNGLKIRGELLLPDGSGQHPLVILGHGLGALKEWSLPEVGASFVEGGIAALWFDFRNFGDSEGEPRQEVDHLGRLEDWHNAISFCNSLPEIDHSRIGIWGTSLGGRDVLVVASLNRQVKAVVSQTPLIKWPATVGARMAGFGDDIDRYYKELAEDSRDRALGKEPRYVPFVKPVGDDVKAGFISQLSKAELRNYNGQLTLQTYKPTILLDITPFVEMIAPTPVQFILAEQDFLTGQRDAYEAAREPKSLVTVKGNHFSPYMESLGDATAAAKEWFVKHLGPQEPVNA